MRHGERNRLILGGVCLLLGAALFLAGVWCGCEKHDWEGSTSELFKPHHGPEAGHEPKQKQKQKAEAPSKGKAKAGSPKGAEQH